LFEENIRLVNGFRIWILKLVRAEKRNHGQWSHKLRFNKKQILQTTLQGKVGKLLDLVKLNEMKEEEKEMINLATEQ